MIPKEQLASSFICSSSLVSVAMVPVNSLLTNLHFELPLHTVLHLSLLTPTAEFHGATVSKYATSINSFWEGKIRLQEANVRQETNKMPGVKLQEKGKLHGQSIIFRSILKNARSHRHRNCLQLGWIQHLSIVISDMSDGIYLIRSRLVFLLLSNSRGQNASTAWSSSLMEV